MSLSSLGATALCGRRFVHFGAGDPARDSWAAWLREAQADYLRGLPMPPFPPFPPPQDLVGSIYGVVYEFDVHRQGRRSFLAAPGRLGAPVPAAPAPSFYRTPAAAATVPSFYRRP